MQSDSGRGLSCIVVREQSRAKWTSCRPPRVPPGSKPRQRIDGRFFSCVPWTKYLSRNLLGQFIWHVQPQFGLNARTLNGWNRMPHQGLLIDLSACAMRSPSRSNRDGLNHEVGLASFPGSYSFRVRNPICTRLLLELQQICASGIIYMMAVVRLFIFLLIWSTCIYLSRRWPCRFICRILRVVPPWLSNSLRLRSVFVGQSAVTNT